MSGGEPNNPMDVSKQLDCHQESSMQTLVTRFVKCQSGTTAIEYGLIAALIGVAIIGALTAVGTGLKNTFNAVKDQL
jgi:pilus assembly protein Flp/PilA